MKPFNLKDALAGKKVVNAFGTEIVDVKKFDVISAYCIAGKILPKNGGSYIWTCKESELYMAPEKKSGWVNLYRRNVAQFTDAYRGFDVHSTKQEAENRAHNSAWSRDFICAVYVEWEE